ncbi:hypothetical protein J6590_000280 [Homalodisca vitripennis]|nr:hypothetical protein J6590_000280 [Homalodisca vitripennis]
MANDKVNVPCVRRVGGVARVEGRDYNSAGTAASCSVSPSVRLTAAQPARRHHGVAHHFEKQLLADQGK